MNLSNHLYVFNHIISHGVLRQGKYYFGELSAWHDVDGYTCYIAYKDLTMSLLFHSRFLYDYETEATLKAFNLLMNTIYTEIKTKKG